MNDSVLKRATKVLIISELQTFLEKFLIFLFFLPASLSQPVFYRNLFLRGDQNLLSLLNERPLVFVSGLQMYRDF